jgi:Zn-dependent M16 (insulinase) family peptidase
MNKLILISLWVFSQYVLAEDNSPFEVRVIEPKLKIADISGTSHSDKEVSNFKLNVGNIVEVKLDLELKNVNHTYEVGGLEWKIRDFLIPDWKW